jgi:hypothetical protein
MNADERGYKHKETTQRILKVFFEVYNELGCGFLESVYRESMAIACVRQASMLRKSSH